MTEPELLPELDTPPGDGTYRHLEDAPPTPAEIAAGNALGRAIDVEDDADTGLATDPGLPPGARRFGISPDQQRAAQDLRTALLDWGVPAVSLELQSGAAGAANRSIVTTFRRNMAHHTVSRPSQGKTPCLALVKKGRIDLPGPLCTGYGGYDRVARIITLSWANHPGAGGPWTAGGTTIPKDNGRPYIFGWEFEGGLEAWTDEMHEFMAQCNGATLQWLGQPIDCHGEHGDPWAKGRKIDRLGYTAVLGRQWIDKVRGEDFDMDNATFKRLVWEVLMQDDVRKGIAQAVLTADLDSPNDKRGKWPLVARIPAMDVQLNAVAGIVEKIRAKVGA